MKSTMYKYAMTYIVASESIIKLYFTSALFIFIDKSCLYNTTCFVPIPSFISCSISIELFQKLEAFPCIDCIIFAECFNKGFF